MSDQRSTYGTKILIPTQREAQFVLDELLGNATDLPTVQRVVAASAAALSS